MFLIKRRELKLAEASSGDNNSLIVSQLLIKSLTKKRLKIKEVAGCIRLQSSKKSNEIKLYNTCFY